MFAETVFYKEDWDVNKRLSELGLEKPQLLIARDIAVDAARTYSTDFHASNGSGTAAYQDGIWALRDQFVGKEWEVSRPNGVETISNEALRIRVGFCNVSLCCVDNQGPKPKSVKKSGSERVANLLPFDELPQFAPQPSPSNRWSLYYLMVDSDGACELTRPIIKSSTFTHWVERIYLSSGIDPDSMASDFGSDDKTEVYKPQISRKV